MMMTRLSAIACVLAGALAATLVQPALAQSGSEPKAAPAISVDTIAPEWIKYDAEAKTVDLQITAALTHVNGGWNFNGYTNGDLTITVPLGWRVHVDFVSRDANVPHSLGIINAEPGSLPPSGDQARAAFRGAYTVPFAEGLRAYQEQSFDFTADKAGTFILYCGVPGHAASGMWDYFIVADGIAQPVVTVKESAQ